MNIAENILKKILAEADFGPNRRGPVFNAYLDYSVVTLTEEEFNYLDGLVD